jgi:periplasmic divalent cation tolerance protein
MRSRSPLRYPPSAPAARFRYVIRSFTQPAERGVCTKRANHLPGGVLPRRHGARMPCAMTPASDPGPELVPAGDARIVFVTAPPGVAGGLARALVERGIAACVNLVPGVTSVYRWQGEVHADPESLLLVKTTRARVPDLLRALSELHPYEVPETLVVAPEAGSGPYLAWLASESRPPKGSAAGQS